MPPKFPTLFSEPGNASLFRGFSRTRRAARLRQIKKLNTTKKFLEFDFRGGGLFNNKYHPPLLLDQSKILVAPGQLRLQARFLGMTFLEELQCVINLSILVHLKRNNYLTIFFNI